MPRMQVGQRLDHTTPHHTTPHHPLVQYLTNLTNPTSALQYLERCNKKASVWGLNLILTPSDANFAIKVAETKPQGECQWNFGKSVK